MYNKSSNSTYLGPKNISCYYACVHSAVALVFVHNTLVQYICVSNTCRYLLFFSKEMTIPHSFSIILPLNGIVESELKKEEKKATSKGLFGIKNIKMPMIFRYFLLPGKIKSTLFQDRI